MRVTLVLLLIYGAASCAADWHELALGIMSVAEVALDRLLDGDLGGALDALTRV